jgi:hypothetical protein
MTELAAMLADLEEGLPTGARDAGSEVAIGVDEVELTLPVESQIGRAGLSLSAPRGRLATGFAVPHGRLRVRFVRELAP